MWNTTVTPGVPTTRDDGLHRFNSLPRNKAIELLTRCCAAPAWVSGVLAARPYADRSALEQEASSLAGGLDASGVSAALAAHPRIGERSQSASVEQAQSASVEEGWSRAEQGSVSRDADTSRRLAEANRRYEARFGRVFLICATGLSGERILASLTDRLGNESQVEQVVVREELRKIALLRLAKALDS